MQIARMGATARQSTQLTVASGFDETQDISLGTREEWILDGEVALKNL